MRRQHIYIFMTELVFYSRAGCNSPTCIVCYIFASVGVHVTHRPCLVSAWWWPAPPRWACNPESAWPSPAPVWRWSRSRRDPTPWTPLGSLPELSKEWTRNQQWIGADMNALLPSLHHVTSSSSESNWANLNFSVPPSFIVIPKCLSASLALLAFSQFRFRNSILPDIATSS